MTRTAINRGKHVALLLGVVMLALCINPAGPLAASSLTTQGAVAITGMGIWGTVGCIACIAGFVVGAGTTIAGLAVFVAANPEIAILCVATCSALK